MTEKRDPTAPLDRPPPRAPARPAALPIAIRILLFIAGWSLLLVGVAGLVLPGIQGILTILVGAAVLSVGSETVYRLLRNTLRPRWPRLWGRIRGMRRRVHERFSRRAAERRPPDAGRPPDPPSG